MGSDYYMNPPRTRVYYELSWFPWSPNRLALFKITDSDLGTHKSERVANFNNSEDIRRFAELVGIEIVEET